MSERPPEWETASGGKDEVSHHEGSLPPPPQSSRSTRSPGRARTDGFALAALILGIFGILGLIFGIIALRRIRRSGRPGRGLAIAGIALSCLWILLVGAGIAQYVFGSAKRSPSGAVTAAGDVFLSDLRIGDCVSSLPTGEVRILRVLPCHEPHAGEVYYITSLPSGSYPGDDQVRTFAVNECRRTLPKYVSAPPGTTGYGIIYVAPFETSWSNGNRKVICIAHDPIAEALLGSIRGRGR